MRCGPSSVDPAQYETEIGFELALTPSSSNLPWMFARWIGWLLVATTACGAADDKGSAADTNDTGAGPGTHASGTGSLPAVGTGARQMQVGGSDSTSGSSSGKTTSAGGTASASGASGSIVSGGIGGSIASGGVSSTSSSDAAEKGLCAIDIRCSQAIVDDPAVSCALELRDSAGTSVYADQAGVELRGRSSIKFPKKNYGIELRGADGLEKPTNLLGMGQESDWVLDGAWADRSFMRNRLSYTLFRDMGPTRWAPRARYCELTLNQKYQGIYVLLEKIKRDDDRVDLPDDDGTGSTFLVKQDDNGTLRLTIGVGSKWRIVYPNSQSVTDVQSRAIQAWLDRLGAALATAAPDDLVALFDQAAVIDWILLQEFTKNVDAYNLSLFLAHSPTRLAWPIPWDLDLSMGQPTIRDVTGNEAPEGWVRNRTNIITRLSAVESLRKGLGPRWRELRQGVFAEAALMQRIDEYATVLTSTALEANFALWPIEQVDFTPYYAPYSFYDVTSYADELTHLRTWIRQRLLWLDANIDSYPSK